MYNMCITHHYYISISLLRIGKNIFMLQLYMRINLFYAFAKILQNGVFNIAAIK